MHVVSMDDVPTIVGSVSFQSKEVNGAQYSEFLLLLSSATISTFAASASDASRWSGTDHTRK